MPNNSTAVSNVIPFDFRGHNIRAVTIDGEPWFVAADACKVLGQSNTTKALYSLDDDERSNFKLGRQGVVNIINESGLYTLILRCDDAIKNGSQAHAFRKWVTAEVLPTIRKHGRYEDHSNKMSTLVDDVIGVSGTNLINGVIAQKVIILPVGIQRQAKHKLHAILHTRFNVPRTELIPADKLDAACAYLAAYVLEGEWIGKEEDVETFSNPKPFQRWLVSFDYKGERQVKEVPVDACVMSISEFLKQIIAPNGLALNQAEVFDFAIAAMQRLKARSAA